MFKIFYQIMGLFNKINGKPILPPPFFQNFSHLIKLYSLSVLFIYPIRIYIALYLKHISDIVGKLVVIFQNLFNSTSILSEHHTADLCAG